MIEFIISSFYTFAEYGFLVLMFSLIIAGILLYISSKTPSDTKKVSYRIFSLLFVIYGFINVFFGISIAGVFINSMGERGTATTFNITQTNNQFNNYWVNEYSVIITTNDNEKVEAKFFDDSFNLYPEPKQGYVYPQLGETFGVRYLKRNPTSFVIVTNDDSPYAKRLRCSFLMTEYNESKMKLNADPSNKKYEEELSKLKSEILGNGCEDFLK